MKYKEKWIRSRDMYSPVQWNTRKIRSPLIADTFTFSAFPCVLLHWSVHFSRSVLVCLKVCVFGGETVSETGWDSVCRNTVCNIQRDSAMKRDAITSRNYLYVCLISVLNTLLCVRQVGTTSAGTIHWSKHRTWRNTPGQELYWTHPMLHRYVPRTWHKAYSFVHLFIQSFIHLLLPSFIQSFNGSFVHLSLDLLMNK